MPSRRTAVRQPLSFGAEEGRGSRLKGIGTERSTRNSDDGCDQRVVDELFFVLFLFCRNVLGLSGRENCFLSFFC